MIKEHFVKKIDLLNWTSDRFGIFFFCFIYYWTFIFFLFWKIFEVIFSEWLDKSLWDKCIRIWFFQNLRAEYLFKLFIFGHFLKKWNIFTIIIVLLVLFHLIIVAYLFIYLFIHSFIRSFIFFISTLWVKALFERKNKLWNQKKKPKK